MKLSGKTRADHRERVERLLGEVVHLVVEDAEEHGRSDADRDRRVRAALVVAERDAARRRDDRGRGERDEIGARGHPAVRDERHARADEERERASRSRASNATLVRRAAAR